MRNSTTTVSGTEAGASAFDIPRTRARAVLATPLLWKTVSAGVDRPHAGSVVVAARAAQLRASPAFPLRRGARCAASAASTTCWMHPRYAQYSIRTLTLAPTNMAAA
ncbi:hypothetical protein MTO96_022290 [Rhipicephalus appendiculatus]